MNQPRYIRRGMLGTLVLLGVVVMVVRAQAPASADKPAAIVNDEVIPSSEVQKLLQRDTPPPHPLTKEQQQEMWKMALDMLIDDALMRQFLKKNAPPATPAEVQKDLEELIAALTAKKTTLKQFLTDTRQTEEQLRQDITARVQWRHYITQKLPDQVLKTYYDTNKVFFDKVFVRANHILFRYPDKATAADKQAVRSKLQALRQDILIGKLTFEEAAKKYSECPSKDKGGDVGHFPYKFAVQEPFARAAFSMKVGEISDVVETEFGVHLIKVTDRTAGEPSEFEKIKEMVRDVYAQELEIYQNIIAEQRKVAKIQYPN